LFRANLEPGSFAKLRAPFLGEAAVIVGLLGPLLCMSYPVSCAVSFSSILTGDYWLLFWWFRFLSSLMEHSLDAVGLPVAPQVGQVFLLKKGSFTQDGQGFFPVSLF